MSIWDDPKSFPREIALALVEGQKLVNELVNAMPLYRKKISSITMSRSARKDGTYRLSLTVRYKHRLLPDKAEIKLSDDAFSFKQYKVVFIGNSFCTIDISVNSHCGHSHFILMEKDMFPQCRF